MYRSAQPPLPRRRPVRFSSSQHSYRQRYEERTLPPGVKWVESIALPIGRAYAYDRLSSAQQELGTGQRRQEQLAVEWCKANGIELDTELQLDDIGRSAFHRKHIDRGAFGKFLRLAQQRRLGLCPVLLIENLDRVSRFEPMDALQKVIFALLDADVTIITLQPGSFEVYEKESCDMMKIIRLVVELEKSHKYAVELSERMKRAWDDSRDKLRRGEIERPLHICPPWCNWDEEKRRYELDPDRVIVVRRLAELFRENGARITAQRLNAEGFQRFGRWRHRKSSSKRTDWCPGSVRDVIYNDALWGAATIHPMGSYGPTTVFNAKFGQEERVYWARRSKEARRDDDFENVPGIFPAVFTQEEVNELRLLSERRNCQGKSDHVPAHEEMRWFGSRRTYCSCGELVLWAHGRTLFKEGLAERDPEINPHKQVIDKRYKRVYAKRYYLKCGGRNRRKLGDPLRCNHPFMPMVAVSAHVLNRLEAGALQAFVSEAKSNEADALSPQIDAAQIRVRTLEKEVDQVADNLFKLASMAMDERVVKPLLQRQSELIDELEEERSVLSDLQAERARRCRPPELDEASQAVQELRNALLDWSSTPEQRRRINRVLADLNVTIHLNGTERLVGLRFGNGEIDWQPLNTEANIAACRDGCVQGVSEVVDGVELVIQAA